MAAWTTIPDSDVDPESPITTSLMVALRDNPIAIAEGASGAPALISPVQFVDTTSIGNVGAGEDDLMTYTLPADLLDTNEELIRVTAYGFGNGADNVTLKMHFGSDESVILNGAAIDAWMFTCTIVRLTATTQQMRGRSNTNLLGTEIVNTESGSYTQTMSGSIVLKFTGENTTDASTGAIEQVFIMVELLN